MTGCFRGCRTDHDRRPTSSRATCGRSLPRQSLKAQVDHGPALRPAADLRLPSAGSSSVSRAPTRIIPSFGVSQVGKSFRTARPSPNTAVTTQAIGMSRLSSRGPARPGWPVGQWGGDDPGHSDNLESARPLCRLASAPRRERARGLARPCRQGIGTHLPELSVPAPPPRPIANWAIKG
jgi:hypothetical protein